MSDQLLELMRVSDADDNPRALFKSSTFYRWHHAGTSPELFTKINGSLFVKLNVLRKMANDGGSRKLSAKK